MSKLEVSVKKGAVVAKEKKKYQFIVFEKGEWRFKGRRQTVFSQVAACISLKMDPETFGQADGLPVGAMTEAFDLALKNPKKIEKQ